MYWIVTDMTCDLPASYVHEQNHFHVVPMSYTMDGESHIPDGTEANSHEIYESLRAGKMMTTAQVNAQGWKDALLPIVEAGDDVLVIAFSSALSGTCAAAFQAVDSLRKKFPDRELRAVDSLAASMGEGLLVDYALKNRADGMSLYDNAAWIEQHRMNILHWFTVDDLMFLRRGGRVSAGSAYLGTVLKIKPILDVSPEGKLIPREKVQGRKRSIRHLCEHVEKQILRPTADQKIFISHGDCREEAELLADMLKEKLGVKDILIGTIGPIVGCHSGPGTIAVFYYGTGREDRQ